MTIEENAVIEEPVKSTNVDNVSGTKETDLINHYLDVMDADVKERARLRQKRADNTVSWVCGKRKNKLMKVCRLPKKFVRLCNSNNAPKNDHTMDNVYTVSVAQTGKTTRRTMTIGFNQSEQKFYTLGNGSMICKLSTGNMNPNELEYAKAILSTAIGYAESANGRFDKTDYFLYTEALPTKDVPVRTFTLGASLASKF